MAESNFILKADRSDGNIDHSKHKKINSKEILTNWKINDWKVLLGITGTLFGWIYFFDKPVIFYIKPHNLHFTVDMRYLEAVSGEELNY